MGSFLGGGGALWVWFPMAGVSSEFVSVWLDFLPTVLAVNGLLPFCEPVLIRFVTSRRLSSQIKTSGVNEHELIIVPYNVVLGGASP